MQATVTEVQVHLPTLATLEIQLFELIAEYSLPEVLDRLAHLTHEQSTLLPNAKAHQQWRQLGKLMEQSVFISLDIKARDPHCGRWGD